MKLPDGVLRPGGLELTGRIMDCCAFPQGARVVDIGCGSGVTVEYLRKLHGMDAVGVDISDAALQEGKVRSACLPLVQGSAEELPFAEGSVAGVLAECSLSDMQEAAKVLAEIFRVLAPGGKLGLTDLYFCKNENFSDASNCSVLIKLLQDNGFRILFWEDQSTCLKEFVAQFIMGNGSLEELWQCLSKKTCEMLACLNSSQRGKLGYFLLVAEKVYGTGEEETFWKTGVPAATQK